MNKRVILRIEESARNEINEAYLWYEELSVGLGSKFITELEQSFKAILKSPNGFQQFHNHRQYPLKKFPFVILYEVTNDILYIDAVFHTSKNPDEKI